MVYLCHGEFEYNFWDDTRICFFLVFFLFFLQFNIQFKNYCKIYIPRPRAHSFLFSSSLKKIIGRPFLKTICGFHWHILSTLFNPQSDISISNIFYLKKMSQDIDMDIYASTTFRLLNIETRVFLNCKTFIIHCSLTYLLSISY